MNQELITQATNIINAIGTKISQGAIYAWPLVVKQQFIEGVTGLSATLFLLVLFGFNCYLLYKTFKAQDMCNELSCAIGAISFLTIPGLLIGAFTLFMINLPLLLNPEYAAIVTVLKLIKG